ncbi:MAG TPA: hypothetical protein VGI43_09120 [Mucilaginibacter sp.]|jgi:hypothetical protein
MKPLPSIFIKPLLIISCFFILISCGRQSDISALQTQVDTLNKQLSQSYKPGLGEFMMGIQVHHAKIWYAGKNQNWKLADFEIGEIKETLEDVKKYCTDRPEIKSLPILYPALDSVANSVKVQNLKQFEKSFVLLTNSCNSCHKATNHEFNVIKIPDTPPFTNQEYKAR